HARYGHAPRHRSSRGAQRRGRARAQGDRQEPGEDRRDAARRGCLEPCPPSRLRGGRSDGTREHLVARPGSTLPGRPAVTDDPPALAAAPRTLRVCKKPAPVRTEFAGADGVCATLEGPVRYKAGDAIVTGVRGEQWPVERESFPASYEPVPPTRAGNSGNY